MTEQDEAVRRALERLTDALDDAPSPLGYKIQEAKHAARAVLATPPPVPAAPHKDYAGRTCTTGLLHSHPEAGAVPAAPPLDWPNPNKLATALYRDYDYTVTPDDIRAAYARLRPDQKED